MASSGASQTTMWCWTWAPHPVFSPAAASTPHMSQKKAAMKASYWMTLKRREKRMRRATVRERTSPSVSRGRLKGNIRTKPETWKKEKTRDWARPRRLSFFPPLGAVMAAAVGSSVTSATKCTATKGPCGCTTRLCTCVRCTSAKFPVATWCSALCAAVTGTLRTQTFIKTRPSLRY